MISISSDRMMTMW